MSHANLGEALAAWEVSYKAAVMAHTWGHLAPKRNKKYAGTMLFAHGEYGDLVALSVDLEGLAGSPWFFEAQQDFIAENAPEQGVYRFTGYFRNYEFSGTVERLEI